jgi:hypothetical protein
MTDTAISQLRPHVRHLSTLLGPDATLRFQPLTAQFGRWLRQLNRAGHCPDLDTLSAAILGGDALLAAIEQLHKKKPIAGMPAVRKAFAGVETVLDRIPLAPRGQEPLPDPMLDIPTEGLLARLLQRVERRCAAPASPAASAASPIPKAVKPKARVRPTAPQQSARSIGLKMAA